MKNRVKPYVAKAELIHSQFQLRLAVVTNQRAWIIGADRKIEEAIDRTGCIFDVHGNVTGRELLRSSGGLKDAGRDAGENRNR
jgi:hypothetical protein